MECRAIHSTLDYLRPDWKTKREMDLANASGIPKSDAVRTNEAHDQSWTVPGRIMGNQKFGSKSRNHGTNPANFLEARFWPTSGLPTIQPFELRSQRKRAEDGPFNYGVAFGSADRQHGLSLGHGRRRTSPLRLPLVPQPGRSARRAEKLSSVGCCIGAPNTSAAVLPRERSGARKRQTPWAC
jgi:hypothetical protein